LESDVELSIQVLNLVRLPYPPELMRHLVVMKRDIGRPPMLEGRGSVIKEDRIALLWPPRLRCPLTKFHRRGCSLR
jgi:hypothetical protein